MEFEQIEKHLEWLDEQQRKNKTTLSDLSDKVTSLETSVNALTKQFRTLTKELSEIAPAAARMNQFDDLMAKQRADFGKLVDDMEKRTIQREKDATKLQQAAMDNSNKSLTKLINELNEITKKSKDRVHEEQRLTLAVQDIRADMDATVEKNKDILQSQKVIEETRRQDAKRLADLQGELAAIRKRADEAREKTVVHTDALKNLENRVNELLETETERKEAQDNFLREQNMAQVERDRAWKESQERYEAFRQQAENMEAQVAALDDSIRAAKRAQEAYEDLNQKLERRIAEVSEMQRLAEDRIHQEWVAFKSDEQKRWTGHSLSQEEAMRDLRKDMDKLEQRATELDDAAQTLQDQLHQTTDTTEHQLQELMNISHEWLTAYERIMGHTKTKAKKSSR